MVGLVLVSFIKFQSRCQLGLQSSLGLTGAGGSASKMMTLPRLETSVPYHLEVKGQLMSP